MKLNSSASLFEHRKKRQSLKVILVVDKRIFAADGRIYKLLQSASKEEDNEKNQPSPFCISISCEISECSSSFSY
jgi:hypothetical protein